MAKTGPQRYPGASTAYWYQSLPGQPLSVPPVAQRLPLRHADLGVVPILPPGGAPPPPEGLTDEQRAMREQHRQKVERQWAEHTAVADRRRGEAREWARRNAEQARAVRARWLRGG